MIRAILSKLDLQGYPDCVDSCFDAIEGLKLIKKSLVNGRHGCFSEYCLILSDLNMPIMDGYDFAKKIRIMMD